jgi:predicted DNA-binding transcriptional regulator AlpA
MVEQSYLDTTQVAKILGMSAGTLELWRRQGQGPAFHKFGRAVRYFVQDVNDWANEHGFKGAK